MCSDVAVRRATYIYAKSRYVGFQPKSSSLPTRRVIFVFPTKQVYRLLIFDTTTDNSLREQRQDQIRETTSMGGIRWSVGSNSNQTEWY